MQESDFVDGLKNRDQNKFRELVNRYQLPLIKLCKGFLHNEEDAKDITQETFIEILDSIDGFRGDAKISTWLYRIAINKSLNFLRKKKYHISFIKLDSFFSREGVYHNGVIASDDRHPDGNVEMHDRKKQIRKALDCLPKNQRIAFVLNKYLNLSYKEIADVMETSVASVESLIHRAKLGLQQRLYKLYRKNLL